jgi:hypothetical protein
MFDHSAFKEIADKACLELREYSGRGMYGKECVGIDCDYVNETLSELVAACENTSDAAHIIRTMKQDSMGLGAIIYWSCIEWSDNAEYGEQEDENFDACADED